MVWANFLHIYQPPTQTREMADRVTKESYEKIIAGVKANPTAKLTLNINAVLTEMLAKYGHTNLISDIKYLLERGQIELTASAKYHPLLPKITKDEIRRQINLNEETNRKYFGESYRPKGFFPPEMGYDAKVGEVVAEMGYKWIILDEMANPTQLSRDTIFQTESGLGVFFRERGMSFRILSAQLGTAAGVTSQLGEEVKKDEYLLTAMDGETFGHHRLGLEELLVEMYINSELPTVGI
ncbi:MAG: polysaccharide deacetylase family protein [Patescibacteria group bacterium]